MIFLSFFMSIKTRIFSHFLAPQAPKIRFWGWFWSDFLNENHRKITGKSSENVRGFLENLEDSRQFPEILGNSRKFSEIPGNSRKSSGDPRKIVQFLCWEVARKLLFHWFYRLHWNSVDFSEAGPRNSRVPKSPHKMDSVGRGPKSIFPPKGRGKLRNGLDPGVDGKIS